MTEAWLVWLFMTGGLLLIGVLLMPRFDSLGMGNLPGATQRDEGRGGFMHAIARGVVLFLGRITFATLHLFEKLGVNMADVDQVLADWTAWSENIKTQLADALADAQNLRDTDAAEDAAQANALSEALAAKVQAAYDAVTSPPVTEPDPEPPVEEPVEEPVVEEPAAEEPVEPEPTP